MYRQMIREALARIGRIGVDPRHVEAFMRLERPCLDGLSAGQFKNEVATGAACAVADPVGAEELAQSFDL